MKETAYLLQAALIALWWAGLAGSRSFFHAFQFEGIPPVAFWSFLGPDVLVIAALSVYRAYRRVPALEYVVLGAFAYASLYCLNATLLTRSGVLPTGLMLAGLAYNFFLCRAPVLFRNTASTSLAWNAVKTLVQIVCVWALALVVLPWVILDAFGALARPAPGWPLWTGAALFLAFSLLGLASSFFMVRDGAGTPLPLDQTKQLVVSGPYRVVRNPMAVAGVGQGLAIAWIFQSLPLAVYALLGAVVWHWAVRPFEEQDLAQRFGRPYQDYRARVRCWIPSYPQWRFLVSKYLTKSHSPE